MSETRLVAISEEDFRGLALDVEALYSDTDEPEYAARFRSAYEEGITEEERTEFLCIFANFPGGESPTPRAVRKLRSAFNQENP